jgi:hypothetical protein
MLESVRKTLPASVQTRVRSEGEEEEEREGKTVRRCPEPEHKCRGLIGCPLAYPYLAEIGASLDRETTCPTPDRNRSSHIPGTDRDPDRQLNRGHSATPDRLILLLPCSEGLLA